MLFIEIIAKVIFVIAVAFAVTGIVIGRSIVLTNDIFERIEVILGSVYKLIALVLAVYFLSPDGWMRDLFITIATATMYFLYRIDIAELAAIDNSDLDA